MKEVLKALFSSKKFLALIAGLASWLVAKAGLDIPSEDLMPLILMLSSYLVGQGVADFGKESAKIHTQAAKEALGGKK